MKKIFGFFKWYGESSAANIFVRVAVVLLALALFAIMNLTACSSSDDHNNESPDGAVQTDSPPPDGGSENTDSNGDNKDTDADNTKIDSDIGGNGASGTQADSSNDRTVFTAITANEWLYGIRIGWSLGNTLDAHDGPGGFSWLGGGVYANTSVTELETGWSRPVTKQEHLTAIKDAGFNAVRIPVTWFKAVDDELNIREDWMARVIEVVDYAAVNDMFIILNTHHDDALFLLSDSELENSRSNIIKLWEQIAETFEGYNEKLAFEGLNEPRTIGSANEWRGGTPEEQSNLNILNQTFVDTVRSTGGNNAERVLLVPTYAASANETAQRAFALPRDTVEDRLIVSLHSYEPWSFALRTGEGSVTTWSASDSNDTEPITRFIDLAYEIFVKNGIPVLMGEMGAINRDNLDARVAWAEFYAAYATSKNITCFWWDNGSYWVLTQRDWGWEQTFGLLDRANIEIAHPQIVDALMRATS
ncbi:MAG: cellulase family glycosylhydrolase [Oscillospiraceae bacterium]|nr:cellulase family glycosylhydrolase [Oscillospiraceae bacterium]